MSANEMSQLTTEELLERYRKFKEELFHVRFQLATGQLEKTHRLQGLRRDLARVLTFLSQKEVKVPAAPKKAPLAPAPKAAKAEKNTAPAKSAAPGTSKDKKKAAPKKAAASAK